MKKSILTIIKIFSIICITILLNSCSNSNKVNEYDQLLSGKHELRKFNVKTTTKTETFGCWFIVVGTYESKIIEESKIRFYFKANNGEYIFKEMTFDKVHIKIDSNAEIPYVKFYWNNLGSMYSGNEIYEKAITHAVIYCKDEDFQPEIKINDLK